MAEPIHKNNENFLTPQIIFFLTPTDVTPNYKTAIHDLIAASGLDAVKHPVDGVPLRVFFYSGFKVAQIAVGVYVSV